MKHLLTFSKTCCTVFLVAAIGLATYGCSDSVSISEQTVEVPLSSLTVTPGTIQPAFSSNTTTYTVDAPTGTATVTVVATPKSSTTLVTIDGTIASQRSISLGSPGSIKIIPIVLESQNGLTSTYTVTVTRLLSGDNNLSALSVKANNATPPLVPGFDANSLDYKVDVQTNVASVTITATKSDPNAAMLVGSITVPAGTNPGVASITLGSPGTTTPIPIEVTAPNGSKKTYTLSIKRLAGDNNLSALNVSVGTLNPVFVAGTTLYTVDVATHVTSVDVSATKSDPNAVMSGSLSAGVGVNPGQATIFLNGPGVPTSVSITVTAPNGDSKAYSLTVNRASSNDNNLSGVTVASSASLLPLSPSFTPSTQDYVVDVASDVAEVSVTATLEDPNASMTIAGQGTSSGQPRNIPLLGAPPSSTTIDIIVIAQDTSQKPYRITANRAAPSSDANLSGLSVVPGTLDQLFAPNTLAYTIINVLTGETVVLVTATKSDPNATMSSMGSVIAFPGTPDAVVQVPLGSTVDITVIAQDAVTSKSYAVTFNP
ncbi:exported hypothetical protein [Candidatus Nitrospira nitrosa]|uniref:Cadherin-like beta-sandwich-like domain-containing protein n=1 Tax=Candidatus Nitrospira nitrosa TaxID=1742972 RepID=A0A0S4LGV0_9BACT|nr:cadherin-like beta sandwich domain-containing protein [Candidatus Nitrospira nitrosa]CUS35869.1 exported hypothetical protein [Candidatus Nitrospira nitrosa]